MVSREPRKDLTQSLSLGGCMYQTQWQHLGSAQIVPQVAGIQP